jgi:hypothetical protein
MLGGIVTGWGLSVALTNSFSFVSALCTSFEVKELGITVSVLNVYGPMKIDRGIGRVILVLNFNVLQDDFVVIGENLNFTWNSAEKWGPTARSDRLG